MKEQKKNNISRDWKLWLFLVTLILSLTLAIFCDTLWRNELYKLFSNFITNYDYGSILYAVQIGVAAFTITLVSFTSSHNNKSYYGLETKDILNIKHKFTLSIFWLTLIELLLVILVVTFYYIEFYFSLLLILIFTLVMCLIYTVQTLPIIMKSEKALVKLLKQSINNMQDFNNNTVVLLFNNYILENGYENTYNNLLSKKNKDFLFERILRTSINSLKDYKSYSDIPDLKLQLSSAIIKQLENIEVLAYSNYNIFKEEKNYQHLSVFISQLFYFIQERKNQLDDMTLQKANMKLSDLFSYLLKDKDNKIAKCIFDSFEMLFKWLMDDENEWFINQIKLEYSRWYYIFTNYYWLNKLFSEMSLLLWYYCKLENLINKEFQQKLEIFINESYVVSSLEYSYTWNDLFKEFLNDFKISLSDFIENFDILKWEFIPYDKSKSCVLTETTVYSWWIKCYLSSNKAFNEIDMEQFNCIPNKAKEQLANTLYDLFEVNSEKFILPKDYDNFVNFFKISNRINIKNLNEILPIIKTLYNFKNNYRKEQEIEYVRNNNNSNLEQLSSYLKDELSMIFKKSPSFDNNIIIPENKIPKGFYVLEEMFEFEKSKEIYKELLVKSFSNEFKNSIEREFNNNYLAFDEENIETTLRTIKEIKPTYTTQKAMKGLHRFKSLTEERINEWQEFDDKLLDYDKDLVIPNFIYANKNGIKFNYDIAIFELSKLQESDMQRILDNYKKDNGIYFYRGIQYEYNELKSLLYEKFFTLKVFIKFEIKVDLKNAQIVDCWGYYNRKQEREKKKE